MHKKITSGKVSDLSISSTASLNINVKIIENFSNWSSINSDNEVHIILEGSPFITIEDKFEKLTEGDILELPKGIHYRYFSKGKSIVYCFNAH